MAEVEVDHPPKRVDVEVFTDGGPWLQHNMFCAVCHEEPAVYNLGKGILQPCHACQRKGYKLMRRRQGRLSQILWGMWRSV